jgi:hypothetical protein
LNVELFQVWFNNRGWAASVSYINVMNNLIMRSKLPAGKDPADYSIVAINHPMEMTKEQLNDEALYVACYLLLGYYFWPKHVNISKIPHCKVTL